MPETMGEQVELPRPFFGMQRIIYRGPLRIVVLILFFYFYF